MTTIRLTPEAFCTESSGAYIQGKVTDIHNIPLEDIRVQFFDSNWVYVSGTSTRTDASGAYSSGNLDPGTYYVKAAPEYPQPYVHEYWYESLEHDLSMPVEVSEGITVSGINFTLEAGNYITGAVVSSTGSPVANVDMDLYNENWTWLTSITCRSMSDGNYRIGAMPPGKYYLRADPSADLGFQQQYWYNAYYRTAATPLIMETNEIHGINFTLAECAAISGSIRLEIGGIATGCEIRLYSMDWELQPIHHSYSDEYGNYIAYGFPAGAYYVEAKPMRGSGYAGCYYPGTSEPEQASLVETNTRQTTPDIDFLLKEGNFDIACTIIGPEDQDVYATNTFSIAVSVNNAGLAQDQLPFFTLLAIGDAYFFWPDWSLYSPPEHPFIDYARLDFPSGSSTISIFDPFLWPGMNGNTLEVEFYSTLMSRNLSMLASNLSQFHCTLH